MDAPEVMLLAFKTTDRPISLYSVRNAFTELEQIWFRFSGQDFRSPHCELYVSTSSVDVSMLLSLDSDEYPVVAFAQSLAQAIDYFLGNAQLPVSFSSADTVRQLQSFLYLGYQARGFTLRAGRQDGFDRRDRPKLARGPYPVHFLVPGERSQQALCAARFWLERSPFSLVAS